MPRPKEGTMFEQALEVYSDAMFGATAHYESGAEVIADILQEAAANLHGQAIGMAFETTAAALKLAAKNPPAESAEQRQPDSAMLTAAKAVRACLDRYAERDSISAANEHLDAAMRAQQSSRNEAATRAPVEEAPPPASEADRLREACKTAVAALEVAAETFDGMAGQHTNPEFMYDATVEAAAVRTTIGHIKDALKANERKD